MKSTKYISFPVSSTSICNANKRLIANGPNLGVTNATDGSIRVVYKNNNYKSRTITREELNEAYKKALGAHAEKV